MNKSNIRYLYLFILAVITATISCKKPYNPPPVAALNSYLVVEGVLNAGSDTTTIKLSRTQQLADTVSSRPERGATVTVEGSGVVNALLESKPGYYTFAGLDLDKTKQYRLRIKTANGKEYLSDPASVKITPPIDSISYVVKPNGVDINVNAHDPANSTHYYRWSYDETWRFHTKFISEFYVQGNQVLKRSPDQQVYYCFANDTSSTIILGSTVRLSQDVVSNLPITNIPDSSEKLSVRYSINLKQYSLTPESYQFWENLKKNTEQLGSIFDALPSQLAGNIHCTTNPAEPVIGYIDICTVSVKRIFIDEAQLPNYQTVYPYNCTEDTVLYNNKGVNEVASNLLNKLYIPTQGIYTPIGGMLLGFKRTSFECADCTVRGTTKQPAYWK